MGFLHVGGPGRVQRANVSLLHAGYNLKADQGPASCLGKLHLNESEVHAVHFSGNEKPFVSRRGKDPLWHMARNAYMSAFSHWAARIGGLSVCVGPRQSHAKGCYEPAANESAWSRRTDTARKRSWS
mmetsp:Transcript_32616/g.104783  ORF Transcript_32616/g.104783 Transcript_32616/m.104783 type:complete len:127 (+) Transcript_32616:746-1126(+)